MEFLEKEKIKCAVCGHINEIMPESGYYIRNDENSLDSKPGGDAIYRIYRHLQICEKCHYVNTKLDELIPGLDKNIINNPHYTIIFKHGIDASITLCAGAFLYNAVQDHFNAGYCFLACAWLCENSHDDEAALYFRNCAKLELMQYLIFHPDDFDYSAILVDIYRRTQDFDEAYDLALKVLEKTKDKSLKHLLKYQISLCLKKDKDIHYVKEINTAF